ncbi:DNA recombination protein RmuC [Candidatus Peregrinibacteria bacterium CG_4_10_14_0_2_um_filter_43_11]|nr:MAG: DNA recombination protein RmuC [Candidatus Peregrinibacteria bacterium CG_4_10_14_0_2_um_filter_43_11]
MNIINIFIIVGIGVVGFLVYQLTQESKRSREEKGNDKTVLMLQEQLSQLRETFDKGLKSQDKTMQDQMHRSQEALQNQFASTNKIVQEVTVELTKIKDTNKQVVGFAEQLKTLENTLKNPKQRGILGEFFLENLLSNVLPPTSFQMQYAFKGGVIVDAIIRVNDKIIPIDAKFSLENYNKIMEEKDDTSRERLQKEFKSDLKKRIDETGKYVKPEENTTEFAFMFIPADGVFYNLLSHKVGALEVNTSDLIDYAFKKNVIIVSPMTFYAYLQTVMHALRALKIEESAKEIQKCVGDLGRHMNAYQDYMIKLGGHLGTTVNSYNHAGKEFMKIDKDVFRITKGQSGGGADIPAIDSPKKMEDIHVEIRGISSKPIAAELAE